MFPAMPSVFPTMSPQESRILWCFLEGDPKPYDIFDIPLGANVNQLKAAIKQRIKGLRHINTGHLTLLKLNETVPINPDCSLAQRLAALGNIATCSTQLSSAEKLGKLFPEPHSQKHLHIVVQIHEPSTSRKRLLEEADGQEAKRQKIDPDLAWLVELHSKIWTQGKERLETLVHKVDVTVAHYRELQRRLEARPNRDSDEDIPAIKLDILLHYKPNHNTPGNEANVSDESGDEGNVSDESDDEANVSDESSDEASVSNEISDEASVSDESGDETNVSEESGDEERLGPFLPTTFEFMDLSSLELKHEPSPSRLPLPLFVRPEYSFILDKIRVQKVHSSHSHMISGQPGTGKTAFLHYMMIKYMLDGIPFLYQNINGIVYRVSDQVEIVESWDTTKNVVAFVDADGSEDKQNIPQMFLHRQSVQFILASSPKGTSKKWVKQIRGMNLLEWVVKLWTRREFFITGIFLDPNYLDIALLRESASYFGFNPRQCFDASRSKQNLETRRLKVTNTIRTINTVPLFELLWGTLNLMHIPHTVFEVFPLNGNRYLTQARVQAVSKWALKQLLDQYNLRQANAAADFYKNIALIPSAGQLRGDMFELRALYYFDTINHPKTFKIRNLATNVELDWLYPGPAPRRAFQSQDLTAILKKIDQKKQPRHLVPLIPNYAASILYDPESVLTGLKATVKKKHPIAVSGLQDIQQSLNRNTSLDHLRPGTTTGKRWRLIFVVSKKKAASFKLQKLEGKAAKTWAKKVDQFVLGLDDEDEIWRPRS